MSWQTYVDTNLLGTGKISKAVILGHDGSQWAASEGFTVPAGEATTLVKLFTDSDAVWSHGFTLEGQKYFGIKADDRSVYGKLGTGGAVCVKTTQAVLVGLYVDPTQPGEAATTVENLADYLIGVGY